ncbi:Bro-N domain-containing protein [Thalassospira lucentensis]|uniref:BRO-N domain-containing protein n=1 Tax=Thalassospira lucentensis TaxID=168935 RepID=UPI002942608B|nr:BRO family protein [Thalassospira lucentensis]WOI08938.1 BRO family protein [Thalassospira lucentensis]
MSEPFSARNLPDTNFPKTIQFQDTELSIIDHDGRVWLTSTDLARALGYAHPNKVTALYNRVNDEFSEDMTLLLKLSTRGQVAPTRHRIFSPRGCHLIAMFARTDRAKEFRKWVLDVLEGLEHQHRAHPDPYAGIDLAAIDRRASAIGLQLQGQVRDWLIRAARDAASGSGTVDPQALPLPAALQSLLEGAPALQDPSAAQMMAGRPVLGVWDDLPEMSIRWTDETLGRQLEFLIFGYHALTREPVIRRVLAGNWVIAAQLSIVHIPDFRFVAAFGPRQG